MIRALLSLLDPRLALAVALAAPLAAAPQSVKLNLPLPLDPADDGGSVSLVVPTPDGARLVYLAREQGDARAELRSVRLDGSAPALNLTAALPPREFLFQHTVRLAPDAAQLVFTTGEDVEDASGDVRTLLRIRRVPVAGGAKPVLLAQPASEGFSFAGEWVVFETLDAEWDSELRSVPLDLHAGAVLLAENATLVATTPQRVLYLGASATSSSPQLFSVSPDGTGRARIDGPLGERGRVFEARATADGTRVVYRADQLTVGQTELFSAPIDGSAPGARISGPLPALRAVADLVALSPDSTRALWLDNRELRPVEELYSAPLDGSAAPVKLNDALVQNGRIGAARFSADGARVLYAADAQVAGRAQLFSVPSDDSGPVVALTPLPTAALGVGEFLVVPGRALYLAAGADGVTDLYGVPADGGASPANLSQLAQAFSDVRNFVVSADGSRVAFFADAESDGRFDLHSAPTSGGVAPVRINPTGRPGLAALTPDGAQVLFTSSAPSSEQHDLLLRPADASAPPVQINGPLSPGDVQGDVHTFDLDARAERVVYAADQRQDERDDLVGVEVTGRLEHVFLSDPSPVPDSLGVVRVVGARALYLQAPGPGPESQLFSVPLDRSLAPVRLSAAAGNASLFQPTRTATSVVFVDRADGSARLYAAPLDGSAPAVLLSGTFVANGGLTGGFTPTPDGTRVLYLADGTLDERLELYSAPIDGSAAPLALSGALVAGGDVLRAHAYDVPRITPDSRIAVYRADALVDDRAELFAVPVDGSAPPRRISGAALVAGGDVRADFALTADGLRVVFCADLLADERFELFSAPVDGSAPPVRLGGALVAGGDVRTFVLGPDGTRVVYLADELKDERFELFVAPVAGGARARRLNAPLVDGGDVQHVELDPRGQFAVYLADQAIDEEPELHLVALSGNDAPRRLSAPLVPGGGVAFDFEITSDSRAVVYLAAQEAEDRYELFHAPLDPRGSVTKLNGPLTPGGDVHLFRVAPDGRRVVYLANQDDEGVLELYLARRLPALRRR